MNSKFITIAGIVCSIIGILAAFKIIFYFFKPSELWTIIILAAFVLLAYGIQLKIWDNKSYDTRWFGLLKESTVEVYEQMTIFGIIPISKPRRRYYEHRKECPLIKKTAEVAIEAGVSTVLKMLPFGGLFADKAALKALGFDKKAIGN